MSAHPPLLAPLLVALLLLLTGAPAQAEVPDVEEAQRRLDHLDALLARSRSVNEDLLAALDGVEEAYLDLKRGETPENEKVIGTWQARAEKLVLKAFGLVKPDRRDKRRNVRDPVNVHAGRIFARLARTERWRDLQRVIQTRHLRARHDVPLPVLEAGFDALAALGDPKALAWMVDEFVHTNASPERLVDQLVAAHQAFVKFPLERIPGTQRHAIVKRFVQLYPATETVARESSTSSAVHATRRFWDRIRVVVIRAAQHFAGTPRNEDGEAHATMEAFADWFREHKDVRRPPWSEMARP